MTTFERQDFHHFSTLLKSFTLSFQYLDNLGGRIITHPIYSGFTRGSPVWFFNHLHLAEHFSLDPRASGILGGTSDSWSYNIGLIQGTMPSLRTLKLTNIALCEELREFCLCRINTLESISLHECHAHGRSGENWDRLFNAIADAAPPCLKEFNLDEDNKESVLDFEGYWTNAALIELAREKIEKQPEARAFPYAYLDDKYGFRGQQGDMAIENYLLGADDKALTELMETIQRKKGSLY